MRSVFQNKHIQCGAVYIYRLALMAMVHFKQEAPELIPGLTLAA
jgi:hypothetical protein